MSRTCKELVQEMCGNLGLVKPNTAVSSNDTQIIQILSILNEEGSKLARRHPWQLLLGEASFTAVATAEQGTITTITGGANNNNFKIIDETMWNRTTRAIVLGPLPPAERQGRLAITTQGPYSEYYIRGDVLYFDPPPAAGDQIYFEYETKNWVVSSDSLTRRSRFTMDDDLPLFDDELLLAGLKWRWNKSKGLDYQEDFQDYEVMVADAMIADSTARRIKLDQLVRGLRTGIFVPSGSWNVS
jgi:hypothetical protein